MYACLNCTVCHAMYPCSRDCVVVQCLVSTNPWFLKLSGARRIPHAFGIRVTKHETSTGTPSPPVGVRPKRLRLTWFNFDCSVSHWSASAFSRLSFSFWAAASPLAVCARASLVSLRLVTQLASFSSAFCSSPYTRKSECDQLAPTKK
jgi:hypothetical protein